MFAFGTTRTSTNESQGNNFSSDFETMENWTGSSQNIQDNNKVVLHNSRKYTQIPPAPQSMNQVASNTLEEFRQISKEKDEIEQFECEQKSYGGPYCYEEQAETWNRELYSYNHGNYCEAICLGCKSRIHHLAGPLICLPWVYLTASCRAICCPVSCIYICCKGSDLPRCVEDSGYTLKLEALKVCSVTKDCCLLPCNLLLPELMNRMGQQEFNLKIAEKDLTLRKARNLATEDYKANPFIKRHS